MTQSILNTKSPALPIANEDPNAGFQNNYSNVLRLYFNQVDNFTGIVGGPLGLSYLDAPHISASDSTDQYALGDDTPTIVKWNTAEYVNGFALNNDNTATVTTAGFYMINFSIQFANNDNTAPHDVFVWLQENGTLIPNSSSRFTVPAAKNASNPGYLVGYSSIMFEATPEDKIGLWWATEQAAVSGGALGVYMEHLPAQTTPYVRPANPSALGSITFLARPPTL